jgi:hypothetical protein
MPPVAATPGAPASAFEALPFRFVQQSSRAAAALLLLLLSPLLAVLIVPPALILFLAVEDLRHAIADKPLAVGMLVLGLGTWAGVFLVPAQRLIRKLWTTRSVTVAAGHVTLNDGGLFASKLWSAPLSDFSGIAHHVRATLSGVRHELVLVHRDRRRRAILLHTADRISQSTIDRAAALFRLPQLPARELYRVTRASAPALGPLVNEQAA